MTNLHKEKTKPDKKLTAVCGNFCPSCTLYIGCKEAPQRLGKIAKQLNCSTKALQCDGCGSGQLAAYCKNCSFISCAREKGIDFCGECSEFPCDNLKKFQQELPHRLELWDYHARRMETGMEQWFLEMVEHYACVNCGTLNSAYDLQCRSCRQEPSCEYVRKHKEHILDHLERTCPE